MANSAQTTSASEQITGSIQQVAAGADQSKRQLDANAVSLQSITAGIMRIAESSTDVSELSRSTATEAENGTVAVLQNVQQMKEIDADRLENWTCRSTHVDVLHHGGSFGTSSYSSSGRLSNRWNPSVWRLDSRSCSKFSLADGRITAQLVYVCRRISALYALAS